jgi:hypothetical protein
MRLYVNLCLLFDNNICLPLDNNICLRWDYVFRWTVPSMDMFCLIGILGSSTFNFHVVNRMLTIWESSVGAFLHLNLLYLYLWYYILHIILHLLSTNHKCTQSCYFPLLYKPAAQKLKKTWSTSMRSSRRAITPGRLSVELWCLFAVVSLRVVNLVFCKTLFGNKYIIVWHWLFCIHFLYGMCVNLIPGHTYYKHSVWP